MHSKFQTGRDVQWTGSTSDTNVGNFKGHTKFATQSTTTTFVIYRYLGVFREQVPIAIDCLLEKMLENKSLTVVDSYYILED